MPRRRRLLNSPRKTPKRNNSHEMSPIKPPVEKVVRTARGRLMGAIQEVLEAEESDDEQYAPPRGRGGEHHSDEDRRQSPQRQSYVLKLFDRSVDLSQFSEDTPLYPICRAWIANQPKANYKSFRTIHESAMEDFSIELPPPQGPVVTRIPDLLPEQKTRNKDNINLDYQDAALPSREQLLESHLTRWTGVRRAWQEQAARAEARYAATQKALNAMYASSGN